MGRCYNSVVVDAPIDQVWEAIRNFHDMSWCDSVINACTAVGDTPGNAVGAKRVLNGAFHETLLSIDEQACSYSYSIDDGPEPVSKESVSNYVGRVSMHPVTDSGGTFVQWETTYEAEGEDLVAGFCNPIYAAILESLKTHFS